MQATSVAFSEYCDVYQYDAEIDVVVCWMCDNYFLSDVGVYDRHHIYCLYYTYYLMIRDIGTGPSGTIKNSIQKYARKYVFN